jgi:hypothetical protein
MFEERKNPSLGVILVFNEVQCDPWPSAFLHDLLSSNVCIIPFVIMRNKDSSYNLNLSFSVGGPSWILAICASRIMKTDLSMGTSSSFGFDSRSSWSF